ncbi:MAG: 30S ribosomal protein S11, partial [Burkholderia gladioli]
SVGVAGRGPGGGAPAPPRHGLGIKITAISDVTPIPHNGCRPPKRRRI